MRRVLDERRRRAACRLSTAGRVRARGRSLASDEIPDRRRHESVQHRDPDLVRAWNEETPQHARVRRDEDGSCLTPIATPMCAVPARGSALPERCSVAAPSTRLLASSKIERAALARVAASSASATSLSFRTRRSFARASSAAREVADAGASRAPQPRTRSLAATWPPRRRSGPRGAAPAAEWGPSVRATGERSGLQARRVPPRRPRCPAGETGHPVRRSVTARTVPAARTAATGARATVARRWTRSCGYLGRGSANHSAVPC
jgi:hypothetical protein